MLRLSAEYLENPGGWRETVRGPETWWATRQEALEHAGYMLRPRYRPGWRPSWLTSGKSISIQKMVRITRSELMLSFRAHALTSFQLRMCMDATRISDGRHVMLKHLPIEEGPYELQIDELSPPSLRP